MRLVVDTNILVSATIKNSRARAVLLHPGFQFYAPEYALHEIEEHFLEIRNRAGLDDEDCRRIIDALISVVTVVPKSEFEDHLPKARLTMREIDEDDTSFIALALSFKNEGIWSDDKDFQKQHAVRIRRTKDLLALL